MRNLIYIHISFKISSLILDISENPSKGYTAQRIDLIVEAHDESAMLIAMNLAWIAESSVALQQVGPL
jgi:hypothetical protein